MIVNGKRALAYIVQIDSITPIEGADNIEMAHVGGWNVIIRKGEFDIGSRAVFFEIDSLLPEKEWSEFLRPKHFKVKTYKLGKFNAISQGLLLPTSILPDGTFAPVGTDVTDILGVTYYVKEDNKRKSNGVDKNAKYNNMAARHKNLAKKKWFRWMMKREWGKKLLFVFLGRKKDKPKQFPSWIKKTDEDRIENMTWILENKEPFVVTEKIDGTSTTFFIDLTKFKTDFGVCSRNLRQMDMNQKNYHNDMNGLDGNVYWEMAIKYDIKNVLQKIADKCNAERVVIQGETYGEKLQGNPLKIKGRDFAAFNLIIDGSRLGSLQAKEILDEYNVPFVPIIDECYTMPDDFEEIKVSADGPSMINDKCLREGFVYRSVDGKLSTKNVSRNWLLKKKD
jgi:hypothetical protein